MQDSHLATILEDIEELTQGFEDCTVFFVPRTTNVASHMLAHFATKLVNDIEWVNDFPIWLIEAAKKDESAVAPFCN